MPCHAMLCYDPQVNALYGFRAECLRRCASCGDAVWRAINSVFELLPVAATIDGAVLCVHGGLGASLQSVAQLHALPRPARVDLRAQAGPARVLVDALWSDPTDHDDEAGVHPNQRGPNTVKFGPDRVRAFCRASGLRLVVRAHQCVQDGFEFFANGPQPAPRTRPSRLAAPLALAPQRASAAAQAGSSPYFRRPTMAACSPTTARCSSSRASCTSSPR